MAVIGSASPAAQQGVTWCGAAHRRRGVAAAWCGAARRGAMRRSAQRSAALRSAAQRSAAPRSAAQRSAAQPALRCTYVSDSSYLRVRRNSSQADQPGESFLLTLATGILTSCLCVASSYSQAAVRLYGGSQS